MSEGGDIAPTGNRVIPMDSYITGRKTLISYTFWRPTASIMGFLAHFDMGSKPTYKGPVKIYRVPRPAPLIFSEKLSSPLSFLVETLSPFFISPKISLERSHENQSVYLLVKK